MFTPDIQYLDGSTRALEDIKAGKYTIKKDSEIKLDTIYRKLNRLKLIVSDSIILYVNPEILKDKIWVNTAG